MHHILAFTVPDEYAAPIITVATVGFAGIVARTVTLTTRLGTVVADLERRVTHLENPH